MTNWRPLSGPDAARRRARMLDRARLYFRSQDVLEVDTPALSPFAASDPNIDSLSVHSASGQRYFLHTSPEFRMKRLLAAGYPDIYSISHVYRDNESGARNLYEFSMIEWYRLGLDLAAIVGDTAALIATCLDGRVRVEETVILNYRDAFQSLAQIDIFAAEPEELARCADADDSLWQAIGPDRNAWLDLILDAVVAPQFPDHRLTVLQHFPASKAALARLCPADSEVADRFEIFAGNMELANGYVELTDANAQRQRIEDELCQRQNAGLALHPVDNRLLQALDAGLPNCAGVAVGVERLQMVLDQTTDIGDVITFRAEGDGP